MNRREKIYDLEDHLVEFGAGVSYVVEALPKTRGGNHIAGQFIRCGLAPAYCMAKRKALNQGKISFTR